MERSALLKETIASTFQEEGHAMLAGLRGEAAGLVRGGSSKGRARAGAFVVVPGGRASRWVHGSLSRQAGLAHLGRFRAIGMFCSAQCLASRGLRAEERLSWCVCELELEKVGDRALDLWVGI